ncbi:MAG: protein kinase, partial [Candidatus Omnitrophica bacterium]|nr:protein kinase [Candidatus Omnitrophota bacterium]
KILHPYRNEKCQIKIFKKEYKLLKKLSHPGIIKVYKFGKKGGLYFVFMEYVDGSSLRIFSDKFQLTPEKILYILIKVGETIEYIHSKKIVHNDIKPENILISNDFQKIKLIDFGFAEKIGFLKRKVFYSGGTEKYIAPERKEGIIDFKSDVYSYSVILEEYLFDYDFFEKIYPIVIKAKSNEIKKRPSIKEILTELRKIYENRYNQRYSF